MFLTSQFLSNSKLHSRRVFLEATFRVYNALQRFACYSSSTSLKSLSLPIGYEISYSTVHLDVALLIYLTKFSHTPISITKKPVLGHVVTIKGSLISIFVMASCLFLTLLPPEVRLQIYRHILVRPLDTSCTTVSTADKPWTAKYACRTAVFRACRQIYNEAYPVLFSANTWVIHPKRADHTWLFGLGLQGQVSLRNIVFEYEGLRSTTFEFEIFNTLSSHTRLSLTINAHTLRLLRLYNGDTMKYMHGFAKATMDELCNESRKCDFHIRYSHLSGTLSAHCLAQRTKAWKGLLDHLTSACPDECEMHVGRPAAHTQSTVHLSIITECFYCEQEVLPH